MAGSCQFSQGFKSWMWIIEDSEADGSFWNEDLPSAKDTSVSLFHCLTHNLDYQVELYPLQGPFR